MKLKVDDQGVIVGLANGGAVEVCDGGLRAIEGLSGELADGQTFALADGCTVTRRGEEEVWFTPAQ